jgi:hypothetical protein
MKAEPVGAALLRLSIKGRIVHAFVHTRPAHGFKFTWQGRVLCAQRISESLVDPRAFLNLVLKPFIKISLRYSMSRVSWTDRLDSALMAAAMNTDNHRPPPLDPGYTDWEKVAHVLAPLFVGKKAPTAVGCSKRATTVRRRLRTGMTKHHEQEKANKLAGKGTKHQKGEKARKAREEANKLAGKGTQHQISEKAKKAKWFCCHGDERAACEIDGCRAPPGANRTASRGGKDQNYVNTLRGRGATLDLRFQQLRQSRQDTEAAAAAAGLGQGGGDLRVVPRVPGPTRVPTASREASRDDCTFRFSTRFNVRAKMHMHACTVECGGVQLCEVGVCSPDVLHNRVREQVSTRHIVSAWEC